MFKKVCLIILNRCWQFLAASLILFAVLISIARYMMPSINNYRDSIETIIAEKSGIQISIGQIEGSWDSLGPFIKISDLRFGTNSDNQSASNTAIKSVKITIATFPTLFYRTLITEQLTIDGLSLKIQQQQSTEFVFSDIVRQTEQATVSDAKLASTIQDWLQHQARIIFFNTHLDIGLHNGHQYPVNLDEIIFSKGKDIYQLTGLSKLPGNNQINFTFEADGFLTDPATSGKLYIDTHKINMPELPINALLEEAEFRSGLLELKLWADWNNKQFESALISLEIDDLLMTLMNQPQTNLNKFKSYLVWQRQAQGWIFDTQETEIISQNRAWPDPSLQIEMLKKNQQKHYSISASQLDIGIWADLLLTNPNLDTDLKKQLIAMDLNGFIEDSLIQATVEDSSLVNFRANARFSELGWQAWKNIPGLSNFAGQFEIHEDSGTLLLDSRNSKLDYPSLFRWPFEVDSIISRISWQLSDKLFSLKLHNLTTDITDAGLRADAKFDIDRSTGSIELNLYAELNDANVAKTKYFLPTGIMTENLVNYLDRSIKSGTLDAAQIALRGAAVTFPYPNNPEGVFAINAQISDTRYEFTSGWPEIEHINADLWFVENSMDIQVTAGDSINQQIDNARISIDDFKDKPSLLLVNSFSKGIVEDGIRYIKQSPLQDSIGKIFNIIPATGPFTLNLDLTVPLNKTPKIIVDGKVHLAGISLVVKPIDMPINNIKGDLIITDSLINGQNLSAEFMAGNSRINVSQTIDKEGLLATIINSKGNVSSTGVRTVFPDWIPTRIEGSTNYVADLVFPEVISSTDVLMDLNLDSNLSGIRSQFPVPFAKESAQKQAFTLNYQILENKQKLLTATLDGLADLKMHLPDQAASSGRIVFGGGKAAISGNEGIELTGQFEQIDLAAWLNLLSVDNNQPETRFSSNNYNYLFINNLLIEQLHYHFMDFAQVKVSATAAENAFKFDVSADQIAGTITVPDLNQTLPIDINLSTLKIADQFPLETAEQTPVDRQSFADPLPPIDIQCQQCIYNNTDLGATTVNIRPLDNGNAFTLNMQGADILNLTLQGDWLVDKNTEVVTNLSGNMKTNKLGDLLTIFNRQTGIHDTSFDTNGTLSWNGDPLQFNYQSLRGQLAVDGGKGNQEDVSDSGARIFSLFSFGSLARKLTLDFSDLFGKGFFYTGMKGNFSIEKGVFATTDLTIDGTSADVEIVGKSDIPNNTIENCVLVTPDLSANLPVLAGWAIEPVTGLLVYLMSKIFQPVLKVVTSIQYKIEGSFEDPVITEIGKSEGTVKVDNSEHIGGTTTIITEETGQAKFSCDNIFDK